jgi:CRP-like cAMP-binding protein
MNMPVIENALQESRFFKDFEAESVNEIACLAQLVSLKAGQYVFQQGDFGEHIYIIVAGRVLLERSTDLGTRTGKVAIDMLGKGRFLGCWSTLLGEPHILMASAYCQNDVRVISIQGAELRAIMLKNPDLGLRVMERLCFLLRDRIQAAYGAMEKI